MWGSKVPQLVLDKLTDVIFPVLGIQAKEGASLSVRSRPLPWCRTAPSTVSRHGVVPLPCAFPMTPPCLVLYLRAMAKSESHFKGRTHCAAPATWHTTHLAHTCRSRGRHVSARHSRK